MVEASCSNSQLLYIFDKSPSVTAPDMELSTTLPNGTPTVFLLKGTFGRCSSEAKVYRDPLWVFRRCQNVIDFCLTARRAQVTGL